VKTKIPRSTLGAVALCLLAGICYWILFASCLGRTSGHFTYAMDDPYIHLSIARDFARNGVWGVTRYANSAASSSPLWVLLLATAISIGGDRVIWPFVFGILFSVISAVFIYYRFIRAGIGIPIAMVAAVAIFAAAPMQILPFTGMEHSLQVFLDLLFVFWLYDKVGRKSDSRDMGSAFLLSALMCLCRFESVFLVVVPFAWSLWRRDFRVAIGLALGPIVSIAGFGLLAHAMGMPWIPNSIVLKGNVPHTFSSWWFLNLYVNLRARSIALWDLFLLCIALGVVLRWRGLRKSSSSLQVILWTVAVTCVLHSGLAMVGVFYRYEAYMIVLLATIAVLSLREILVYSGPSKELPVSELQWFLAIGGVTLAQCLLTSIFWIYQLSSNLIVSIYAVGLVGLAALAVGPPNRGRLTRSFLGTLVPLALYFMLRDRAVQATQAIQDGSQDIYLQQIQMSRFVDRYYRGGRVVVNDIGAVSYFSDVHLLDLWGLATDSIRDLKLADNWNTKTMEEQFDAFRPDVIIAYPDWYRKNRKMPPSVVRVATWTIPKVTSAGRRIVGFYAPIPKAEHVQTQLKEFERSLPKLVTVSYPGDDIYQ